MALPNPLIVLLKGNQTLTIEGAVSETLEELLDYADTSTFRNLFPASYLGRAWVTGGSSLPIPFSSPGVPESLDDQANEQDPRPHFKPRNMMKWWNGAGGTGEVVGKCWQDQFIGYGSAADFMN